MPDQVPNPARMLGTHWYNPGLLSKLTDEGRLGLKTRAGIYDYTPGEAHRIRDERDLCLWSALRSRAARQDVKEEAP